MTDQPLYRPDQLRAIVPQTWVHYGQVVKSEARRKPRFQGYIRILRGRITIGIEVWEAFGKPAKVTLFFEGQDTFLLPADDMAVEVLTHHVVIPLKVIRGGPNPFLIRGNYGPDRWKLLTRDQLKYLQIKNSFFTNTNTRWPLHWRKANLDGEILPG
jgi:hypothetical protein